MDNKVRQVCTSKTALDARGHKSDIGLPGSNPRFDYVCLCSCSW